MYPFIENMISGKKTNTIGNPDQRSDSQEYIEMQVDAFLRIQKFNKYSIFSMLGLEILFMFAFMMTEHEGFEITRYIVLFILRPMILVTGAYFLAKWSLKKVETLREAVYSQLIVTAFIAMIILMVHYVYQITLVISIVPLALSILFTDKKLSWTVLYFTLATHTVGILGALLELKEMPSVYYPYTIVLSYVFLILFEVLVQILIEYSLKMQAITKSSYNYASILKKKSEQDSLTQLYNHESFMEILNERISILKNTSVTMHVAMLDIDKFKLVNDTWGHTFGDVVLKRLSDILRNHSGNGVTVARYGGEEFILLFEGFQTGQVEEQMELIKQDFQQSHYRENYSGTFSAGITQYDGKVNATGLVERADDALYYAKEHGRNRICCYEVVCVEGEKEET